MAASGRSVPRKPGPPAGVIFGCNRASEDECLNGLFGMSSGHWGLVKEILPGTPCFLFNFNTKVRASCPAAVLHKLFAWQPCALLMQPPAVVSRCWMQSVVETAYSCQQPACSQT